jgi:N-acetylmuramic acid 6-phosphate etherase
MVKMGRVYRGLMVDMRARNAKLRRRAEAMVSEIVRCPEADVARYLEQAEAPVAEFIAPKHGTIWQPFLK